MTHPLPDCIFHITSRVQAQAALASGSYSAPSLATEGFIHLSQAHQVLAVARAFYAGQPDLVVLVVDPTLLQAELRFEAPATFAPPPGGDARLPDVSGQFPHLYGPLNADAILDVAELRNFRDAPIHPDTVAVLRQYRFARLPVEGTLFKSTWRSDTERAQGGPEGTAMIGLYAEHPFSVSCFHRLAHDEVWHFYGGDPCVLHLLHPDGRHEQVTMGPDASRGQCVQLVIPRGVWQAGHVVAGGRHSLFGCTMSPGFTGGCFEAAVAEELIARHPDSAALIRRLSVNGDARFMPEGFAA